MRARVRQVLRRRHQEIQGDDAGIQPGVCAQAREVLRGPQRPPRGSAARNAGRRPHLSADEAARYGVVAGWVRQQSRRLDDYEALLVERSDDLMLDIADSLS